MKKTHKKALRIVAIILAVAILFGSVYFLTMNPYRGTVKHFDASLPLDHALTQREALRDLKYFTNRLKGRHPAWLDGSTELVEAVEAQYQTEVDRLGEQVTVLELWQASSRIAAQLSDGHTLVNWTNPGKTLYIDNFKQLDDYGAPLTIDGFPTQVLLDRYLSLASYEFSFYAEARFLKSVIVAEQLLTFCGVDTSDGVDMTFLTGEGAQTFHYVFVPLERVVRYDHPDDEDWVRYTIDLENDLGIFTLKSCNNNEEYQSTLDAFFAEVFENGVSNIVVDLRGNGGGNSSVANEFLRYIDVDQYKSWDSAVRFGWYLLQNRNVVVENPKQPETFDGNLYVLTDTFTYSAAMDFAMLIGDNDLGVLVGSPSGNRPDGYGDILYFQMPNSGLAFSVSYKGWQRVDASKAGEPLMPDHGVPPEEALDKVLDLIAE